METEFRYMRDLGLNTVRLEGKLESQAFYDLADKYGIFVMAGWCCCDIWERWNEWGNEQYKIAQASQHDQMRLLRNHPSMLVWLNGSDNPPIPAVESMYLRVEKESAVAQSDSLLRVGRADDGHWAVGSEDDRALTTTFHRIIGSLIRS